MTTRTTLMTTSLIAASLISGAANATLMGRDLNGSVGSFEAYYDTDLDITWLADANYADTSGYAPVFGLMDWATANTWAANLSFTDGVNVYDNWRLPTTLQPDASCAGQDYFIGYSYGYKCTGSEMAHLYTELGGDTEGQSISSSVDPDLAKFTNFEANEYWSASEFDTVEAWRFNFGDGGTFTSTKDTIRFALAVSSGDVGAANNNTVPEPQTLALVGLGLLGLAVARRRG